MLDVRNLKYWRLRRALSQRDLAAKASVSQGTVVKLERGQLARPLTVRRLAAALEVSVDELLGMTESGRRPEGGTGSGP